MYLEIEQNGLSNQCGVFVLGDSGGTIIQILFIVVYFCYKRNQKQNSIV